MRNEEFDRELAALEADYLRDLGHDTTVFEIRTAQDTYIRAVAGSKSATDEIARAKELLEAGTITDAEFGSLVSKVNAGGR